MYTWLKESQFERFSKVQDKDMNEIFQEVRNLMPDEIFIEEREVIHKGFFGKKKTETRYTIYHRSVPGYEEVHVMNLSGDYHSVCSYLFGLFNGYHNALKKTDGNTIQEN